MRGENPLPYESLPAPIQKGQIVGTAWMESGGEVLASCPLLAAEDVHEWDFGEALRSVLRNWLLHFDAGSDV